MNPEKMKSQCAEVSNIMKAIAHPQRLMIMCHLAEGEKNVGEILELCEISQSQLSQFLNRMQREKLLKVRRESQFSFYSIADIKITKLIQSMQAYLVETPEDVLNQLVTHATTIEGAFLLGRAGFDPPRIRRE
jgi:DNA-binding transcriptional ArsR family regulator